MFFEIIKKSGIGRKLLTYILLFSSVVTFLGTSLQLYIDYDHDIKEIHNTFEQIESSYLHSISSSLWVLDEEQVTELLNGVLQLPDIQRLEISQNGELLISVGQPQQDNIIQQDFLLSYKFKGQEKKLGILKATASLTGLYKKLWDKTALILGTQAVKTFLVSTFIFFIFYTLVGKHLIFMADYARSLNFKLVDTPLNLKRKPSKNSDELEALVQSINIMRENIFRDIEERKQAEENFQTIVHSTVGNTGQEFFDNICTQLGSVFKSNCTIVGELVDDTTVNAIAMVLDGKHIRNYRLF